MKRNGTKEQRLICCVCGRGIEPTIWDKVQRREMPFEAFTAVVNLFGPSNPTLDSGHQICSVCREPFHSVKPLSLENCVAWLLLLIPVFWPLLILWLMKDLLRDFITDMRHPDRDMEEYGCGWKVSFGEHTAYAVPAKDRVGDDDGDYDLAYGRRRGPHFYYCAKHRKAGLERKSPPFA